MDSSALALSSPAPSVWCNTNPVTDFRYAGVIHVKVEWVERAVEKLRHLCHLYSLLFSL